MRSRRRDAQRLRPEKCRGRRGRSPLGHSDAPPPRLRPGAWGWRLPAGSGCEDSSSWANVLGCHGEVLRARASPQGRLETLERWCREELPAAIEKHVTRDELEQLLAWKLAVRSFPRGGRSLPGRDVAPWAWLHPGGGPSRLGAGPLARSTSRDPRPALTTEGPLSAAPAAALDHQLPAAGGAALGRRLLSPARRERSGHGIVRPPGRGPGYHLALVGRAGRPPGEVVGGTWRVSGLICEMARYVTPRVVGNGSPTSRWG
ncbi:uncharacterized protein LOC101280310 [Orcinus orca]|uniref:uncharacterized protein LOC101280310 n=1 Tax=Orcinus orca TaxID=9733 RepID=UPI00144172FF|nr:uncharacterized protein LOC101280310 [Orcinus orca]